MSGERRRAACRPSECGDAMDDLCLVRRFRAGETAAFVLIDLRHRRSLERHAERVLGDRRQDAEDVVQDALVRAHDALLRDDREVALGPWLHRIVRNRCLDELRRQRPLPVGDPAAAIPGGQDPHEAAVLREGLDALVEAVAALPDRQRHVVAAQLNGSSHGTSGRSLGTSPGASKALLHRARGSLRAALQEAGHAA